MSHSSRTRRHGRSDQGFTLIELLVVVIIIGILAAIAIPLFLRQRDKADDAAIQSDLRNFGLAEQTYFAYADHYTATPSNLDAPAYNLSYSSGSVYMGGTAKITVALLYATDHSVVASDAAATGGFCADATAASGDSFQYDSLNGGLHSGNC